MSYPYEKQPHWVERWSPALMLLAMVAVMLNYPETNFAFWLNLPLVMYWLWVVLETYVWSDRK